MKKAVMIGAGNIGRGFIGQLFSQSGYEVVFVDINAAMIERFNRERRYPVMVTAGDGYETNWVEPVRGILGSDLEAVAQEIADADILATAVGVNVLRHIAGTLAFALSHRWRRGCEAPLNVLVCENRIEAPSWFRSLVAERMEPDDRERLNRLVGFVEVSIGRMVPATPAEIAAENPLAICVEPYCALPVDRDGFVGPIPEIRNMKPTAPFRGIVERKLFLHNMGHAAAAYLGALCGCDTIWEAMALPAVSLLVLRALQESLLALGAEHGHPVPELMAHVDDLVYRFGNRLLGDPVSRVARDPVRKLGPEDRLAGSVARCRQHGIMPVHILLVVAAALRYRDETDPASLEVQAMVAEQGVAGALWTLCGWEPDDEATAIVVKLYAMLEAVCDGRCELADLIGRVDRMRHDRIQRVRVGCTA